MCNVLIIKAIQYVLITDREQIIRMVQKLKRENANEGDNENAKVRYNPVGLGMTNLVFILKNKKTLGTRLFIKFCPSLAPISVSSRRHIYFSLSLFNMDFQNRAGGKTGSGGVASYSESNRDRRERLRQLALETIDLNKVKIIDTLYAKHKNFPCVSSHSKIKCEEDKLTSDDYTNCDKAMIFFI